ncbi:MAG: heme ABC exporter ATP-binding protein CcmA [Caulobacteraceae bacterium]
MIDRLVIDALAVHRGDRLLFRALNLAVEAGEAVALTGANGVGKTSLLRALAGFIRPTAGTIAFTGPAGPLDADAARRGGCHLIGHQDALKAGRTARAELLFQTRWADGDSATALDAARRLGIERALDLEVRKLSAGQRRRLALCRLIAAPRALWLLDEPLAPLDHAGRALVASAMTDHLAGGGLILAAIHDRLAIPARDVELGA